ncbi:hypothetical protein F5X96DRAFT_623275 [Biscogniauxia mediterranea]|nr:hypothetical protein F5X96DRAFT_623275 [Biscogniauxia mediterranea]
MGSTAHYFLGVGRSTCLTCGNEGYGSPSVESAVASWHRMSAWPDVLPALTVLKTDLDVELFVLANGTTRLQLDLVRASGLAGNFDMPFSRTCHSQASS